VLVHTLIVGVLAQPSIALANKRHLKIPRGMSKIF
jgi:hypothetical protein